MTNPFGFVGWNDYTTVTEADGADLLSLSDNRLITIDDLRSSMFTELVTRTVQVDVNTPAPSGAATVIALPAGAIIHEIIARVKTALDGSNPTFEVGIASNMDKYIDTLDLDAETLDDVQFMTLGTNNDNKLAELCLTSMIVLATWTNIVGMAGTVSVYVTYSGPA